LIALIALIALTLLLVLSQFGFNLNDFPSEFIDLRSMLILEHFHLSVVFCCHLINFSLQLLDSAIRLSFLSIEPDLFLGCLSKDLQCKFEHNHSVLAKHYLIIAVVLRSKNSDSVLS
jgi:hypothetical protein